MFALLFSYLTIGCGGGGAGVSGGDRSAVATGQVSLPPGSGAKLATYSVMAAGDKEPLTANGTFRLKLQNPGETLVTLVDGSGHVAMIGYADTSTSGSPESAGHGQISAATTATALLFYGVSGFTLPSASWPQLTAYIAASPQNRQVAAVIAARIAANPSALANNDAQISSAVLAGARGLAAGHVSPQLAHVGGYQRAANASATIEVVRKAVAKDAQSANLILVKPSGEQSGVEVLNNSNGPGIVFVNHLRRRCEAFIYETARQAPGDSKPTDIDPVIQPFTQPSLTSAIGGLLRRGFGPGDMLDIQPSSALHGHVGAIIDAAFGSGAFTPASTGPIILEQDGKSVRTDYTVVVVGPSFDSDLSKFFPLKKDSVQIRTEWQNAVSICSLEETLLDILIPVIASIPLGPKFNELDLDIGLVLDIVNAAANVPDLMTQVLGGRIKDAINTSLQNSLDAGAFREAILKALWTATFGAGTFAEKLKLAETELEEFFFVTSILDFILQLLDSSAVFKDSAIDEAGQSWTVSVLEPKITLSPNPASVNSVQTIAILTAQLQNVTDLSNYRFKWSTTGTQGHLEEPYSSIAMPVGPTTFNECAYVADELKLKSGQADTVTVTLFSVDDINAPLVSTTARVVAQPSMELGTYTLDTDDDFIGLVKNDPWVVSAVATVPLVSGATKYTVELKNSIGNQVLDFYIDASGKTPVVFDLEHRVYDHVIVTGSSVKIAAFGTDAANSKDLNAAAKIVMNFYHVAAVDVYFQ